MGLEEGQKEDAPGVGMRGGVEVVYIQEAVLGGPAFINPRSLRIFTREGGAASLMAGRHEGR